MTAATLTQPPAPGGPRKPAPALVAIASPTARVVARWAAPGPDGHNTGYLAVLADTADGRRLVIAERRHGADGTWHPTRTLPANDTAVRRIARQHGHGTTTNGAGGLLR